MTFRTTFRETLSSRQINLIDLPCTKNARRIFAIVSKTSIPTSASKNHGSHCGPSAPGSLFHADSHALLAALMFYLVGYLPDTAAGWLAENLRNALIINVILAVFN